MNYFQVAKEITGNLGGFDKGIRFPMSKERTMENRSEKPEVWDLAMSFSGCVLEQVTTGSLSLFFLSYGVRIRILVWPNSEGFCGKQVAGWYEISWKLKHYPEERSYLIVTNQFQNDYGAPGLSSSCSLCACLGHFNLEGLFESSGVMTASNMS